MLLICWIRGSSTHITMSTYKHTTQEGLKYYSSDNYVQQPCKGCTYQNSAQLGNDKQPWFIYVVMDATYLFDRRVQKIIPSHSIQPNMDRQKT